ncbi:MAG: ATP-binding protein [Bacteroidota bacterium]
MQNFLPRSIEAELLESVGFFPATAIVGPRQVGKTSLALSLETKLDKPTIYLDLENPDELRKLENANLFFEDNLDKTVILDEVQRMPELFPILRGAIDRDRQAGRFILLGSASPELIRDSSETLAGRITYLELKPFGINELPENLSWKDHWLRGGFPESLFAPSVRLSNRWMTSFIQTYLERDLPMLGLSADPVFLRALWQMVANMSGSILNAAKLSNSLDASIPTIQKYLNFFERAYLVRHLPAYHPNLNKRLVKKPKIYLRDTGVMHRLLGISSMSDLLGHPALGGSWETYVIEQIEAVLPDWADLYFYRTQVGAEVDLVITKAGLPFALVELKSSTSPSLSKGFYSVADDLDCDRQFIVAPIEESYRLTEQVNVLGPMHVEQIFA